MRIFTGSGRTGIPILGAAAIFLLGVSVHAQQPEARITAAINSLERTTLPGSHSPQARAENEAGRVPSGTRLEGISIVFSRTAAQETDLQALIASQQDPTSPMYQHWVTPEEFGARFGVADADIAAVATWLEQLGFTVDGVSRSRNQITFSGTVQQAEQAFGTELHYYNLSGEQHFAPHADLTLPTSLAPVVQAVTNLSTFRPRSHVKQKGPQPTTEYHFTSGQSGNHYLTPKDLATIYDINAAYSAGLNGSGQSIAVLGQSPIAMTDIEHFQTASTVFAAPKDPILKLVPSTGTSTTPVTGDESESDLDLEYASTVAPGATIYFVYTGGNANTSVWDSMQYAITQNLAPVISMSYGLCEPMLGQASYNSLNNTFLAQASTQGQTVIAAAGDGGSADCSGTKGATTAQQQALSVDFPASSQYVTGIGGTEFPANDVAAGNTTYWTSNGANDVISSARSYIPEQVWNDTATGTVSAGGGGVSAYTSKPGWQSGVGGIASGTFRFVPDISLSASPNNAGYLYCSGDTSTKVTGSCANGLRDSSNTYLTVAGGTSFGAPIFAGMMAIVNQKMNAAQGLANTKLYALASNATTYASAFHDITSGNNNCSAAGATVCPTTSGAYSNYSAGTGYDQATGLGSIDFNNLLTAWSGSTSLVASNTTVTPATTTPASGANDTITITVASASASSTTTPTGTLSVSVDGVVVNASLPLSSGSATYAFSSATAGSHTITATYSGDATYNFSNGSTTVTVSAPAKSFTLAATSVTVPAGSTGSSTVSITPQNGYTGTIAWTVSSNVSTSNVCFAIANASVTGTTAVTATLTVKTTSTACGTTAMISPTAKETYARLTAPLVNKGNARLAPLRSLPAGIMIAAFFLVAFGQRRSRELGLAGCALLLLSAGLMTSGCSSSGSSPSSTTAAKGTYTVTITGTDTVTSSITTSTSMTLTID
jgi:subtilase family serine protease